MEKITIVTSYVRGDYQAVLSLLYHSEPEMLIAADKGYEIALDSGLMPDIIVGDFDSAENTPTKEMFPNSQIIKVPKNKDFTDFQLAMETAVKYKPEIIEVIGGIGGRSDHTLGNIQTLSSYTNMVSHLYLLDCYEEIAIQAPGTRTYNKADGLSLGIVALSENVESFSIEGAEYECEEITLNNKYPRCVSNSFVGKPVKISFKSGTIAVITSSL